jgi:hypothetical protein
MFEKNFYSELNKKASHLWAAFQSCGRGGTRTLDLMCVIHAL